MSFEDNLKKIKKDARDSLIPVNVVSHENGINNSNSEQETNDVIHKYLQVTEQEHVTQISNITVADVKQDLLSKYEAKTRKETVESTHTRSTFLFRNDLQDRLNRLANNRRGFKTLFINKAIEALLDEMERE